jgi:hypothetical protein
VAAVLGAEAPLFAAAYDVTAAGNWEGRTILHRVASDAGLGEAYGLSAPDVARRLDAARARLLEARRGRPQPARDEKALAAWNGLALGALADAGSALERPDYLAAATRAADSLLGGLLDLEGRLRRSWKDGRALQDGVLEDYAHLAGGLLDLYEATFEERWFTSARTLLETVLARFADRAGGFFDTADDHERLIARPKGLQDNALPSGNAMAATALLRLAALSGEGRYRTAAEEALGLVADLLERHPTAFAQWLIALDLAARPIDEVAVIGEAATPGTIALLAAVRSRYRPRLVLAAAGPAAARDSAVALLHDRTLRDERPTAYVCHGFACRAPVTTPEELTDQLDQPVP